MLAPGSIKAGRICPLQGACAMVVFVLHQKSRTMQYFNIFIKYLQISYLQSVNINKLLIILLQVELFFRDIPKILKDSKTFQVSNKWYLAGLQDKNSKKIELSTYCLTLKLRNRTFLIILGLNIIRYFTTVMRFAYLSLKNNLFSYN